MVGSALCGCKDPRDLAAKARIFAEADARSEDRAPALAPLDPTRLADDLDLATRTLGMPFSEAGARAGALKSTSTLRWTWRAGGRELSLAEERLAERTLSGDLHGRVDTDRGLGMEGWFVNGAAFARERYTPVRPRPRADRIRSELWADRAYGSLRTFDALFRGALRLARAGEKDVGGRAALRYTAVLGEPTRADPTPAHPPIHAQDGVDTDTQLRQTFLGARKPEALRGEVVVDARTGVVLSADLAGKLSVPGETFATLEVTLTLETRLGAPASIAQPEVEPLPERPPTASVPPSLLGKPAEPREKEPAADDEEGDEP